jgi:RNA polymerase sigma factor (sigma-70 family)
VAQYVFKCNFLHYIAGTISEAQEQFLSNVLVLFCYSQNLLRFIQIWVTNRPSVLSVSAERGKKPFRFGNFNLKGGEIMKPSSFENAIRLQFDCLARKVIGRTVKNYNKELARRSKHEISFCEIPELELNQLCITDEYSIEFTSFDVFGTEVRVYDEKLCEAIKKLSERRRNVVLMFYFLELPDAEIAEILDISRNSVYRNRMCSLKLIKDMYEEEL